ncbi:PTCH1 family protein [Megaselia abdita]
MNGKARGNEKAIYFRALYQSQLQKLGRCLQKHSGKVLFVAFLVLSSFSVGLKSAQIHSTVNQLWIQEGGRLEDELKYTRKILGEVDSSTHQLLIQTSNDPNASVLHANSLLAHLDILEKATSVKVRLFDSTWDLRDICTRPSVPNLETRYIEGILERFIPCSIITPLDCFWEGSQLDNRDATIPYLNTGEGKINLSWLNPQQIVEEAKLAYKDNFSFDTVEHYMKRAGITTGYSQKPCLNTTNPKCPNSAPNKNSTAPLDIGAILTKGCYGYASKLFWPGELIVGGSVRNRTGHLKKAKGLQTVIQLMSDKELYDYFSNDYKTHNFNWTPEKAAEVLTAWQRSFTNKVNHILKNETSKLKALDMSVFVFSSTSLDDILEQYSIPRPYAIAAGVCAIAVYSCIVLINWKQPVKGQVVIGVFGIILIVFSTTAGLGFCSLLGIYFNASTSQVVPYLSVGLGVMNIFMMTGSYRECGNKKEDTKLVLSKAGPIIIFNVIVASGSCFAAAFIPLPALYYYCLQMCVVTMFNLAAAILVFPAFISLDLLRRSYGKADIFCCQSVEQEDNNPGLLNNITVKPVNLKMNKNEINENHPNKLQKQIVEQEPFIKAKKPKESFTLSNFAYQYYAPFLMKGSVKFCSSLVYICWTIFGLYSLFNKLQDGLDLVDLVPKDTNEYKFLQAQTSLFGFYNMHAVTQGNFEYPQSQKKLYEYHNKFVRVPHVVKNDNGGLPDFWLTIFRDWLKNLQDVFDKEYKEHRLTQEGWSTNASSDAILAYKLMVQTGDIDNSIQKSLIPGNRLVKDGIINPTGFYNYLSAWATNDLFGYGSSQGKLRPEPMSYVHSPGDYDLKIPKSLPLVYTQLPFNLHGLKDTVEIKELIKNIRKICDEFENNHELSNYPSGIPFIFWEQYMDLRTSLLITLAFTLAAAFVCVFAILLSFRATVITIVNVIFSLIQLPGAMVLLGLKLSAIPAVIIIFSVGLMLCFTVNIALSFMTSLGNKERRTILALEVTMDSLIHGLCTFGIGVLMLLTSPFEFVIRHFFWLLFAVLSIGAFNGLVIFPIILSIFGPEAELISLHDPNRISTPSPVSSKSKRNANKTVITNDMGHSVSSSKHHGRKSQKYNINEKEPSLTTITEEPPSWKSSSSSIQMMNNEKAYTLNNELNSNLKSSLRNSNSTSSTTPSSSQSSTPRSSTPRNDNSNINSNFNCPELQSIVVQPEVIVETHHSDSNTTKVTATANIKVEFKNFNFKS